VLPNQKFYNVFDDIRGGFKVLELPRLFCDPKLKSYSFPRRKGVPADPSAMRNYFPRLTVRTKNYRTGGDTQCVNCGGDLQDIDIIV